MVRLEELVAKRRELQLSSLEVMIEWIKVSAASGVRNFRIDRTFLRMISEEDTVLGMCRLKERESSI